MAEQGNMLARVGSSKFLMQSAQAWNGIDFRISEQADLGLATVMSRGMDQQLAERVFAKFNVKLPSSPLRISNKDIFFIGIGPGTWLCGREGAGPNWVSELESQIAGLASVSDQTSGYTVLRLSGMSARVLLSRGAFIDFDPQAFGPGSAAVTQIGHIGAILWQLDDLPTYEVAVFRSLTESFLHWVETVSRAISTPALVNGRASAR